MNVVKTFWAAVQGDPVFMRRLNGWLTVLWAGMIPVSVATGWVNSVQYVAALSMLALVTGHWSAWQSARVEVFQQHEYEELANNPIEERIVEAILSETTLEAAEGATT
jgi:hypothetical protein